MSPLRPVIVGGGPAGLSAAKALAEHGLSSLLLEQE
uniref:FAD-binding protein n=1 Tax=Desulfobacca acetoxidans TaxID=60893 RepID=A0A7V6A5A6_9BACT